MCVKSCNGFAHSNGDVRDAARELTVALHDLVGEEVRQCVPHQVHVFAFAFAIGIL